MDHFSLILDSSSTATVIATKKTKKQSTSAKAMVDEKVSEEE
jgi:hypothetical protein